MNKPGQPPGRRRPPLCWQSRWYGPAQPERPIYFHDHGFFMEDVTARTRMEANDAEEE